MGLTFFKKEAVAEVGVFLADHHGFAQYDWYSTRLGKNFLIRLGNNNLYNALIHKKGVHILRYPLSMLELDRDRYQRVYAQTEKMNPPLDFELPEADEIQIRLFRQECSDDLLDFDYRKHRAVNNFYCGHKDGWNIGLVFLKDHVMGVGIESNLIVK